MSQRGFICRTDFEVSDMYFFIDRYTYLTTSRDGTHTLHIYLGQIFDHHVGGT